MASCYRHPSRETGVSCSNCGRPICPECMTPTSVGMRCPECAGQTTRVHRGPVRRNAYGGREFVWNDPSSWSVTGALIAVNCIVFLVELAGGLGLGGAGINSTKVVTGGWLAGPYMTAGHHEYYRLLTSGFLHESMLHIGMNMLSLWFVGRVLEPGIGRAYFAAIYLTSLLVGSFGVILLTPLSPSLGASGAIFGVFGALIVVAHDRRIPLWSSGLMPMLVFNLVFTLAVPNVSAGAHGGGLVGGLITGWLVVHYGERRQRPAVVYGACVVISLLAIAGAIALAGQTGLAPGGTTI